jgi:hypothetical protein
MKNSQVQKCVIDKECYQGFASELRRLSVIERSIQFYCFDVDQFSLFHDLSFNGVTQFEFALLPPEAVGPGQSEFTWEGERKVRFVEPEFNLDELSGPSAACVREVTEEAVRRAPLLKCARLRKVARSSFAIFTKSISKTWRSPECCIRSKNPTTA